MIYVALDVGCIECGEESSILGLFYDEGAANKLCEEAREEQEKDWHGQHSFEVHVVENIYGTPPTP